MACHVIILIKFGKLAYWWRIVSLLINKWAFLMQIEIIYLTTSGMIFLNFVFRRNKWSKVEFCWKNDLLPCKFFFFEKRDGHKPLALRGHVISFLWKWKLHDFAFEKLLVGHLLNKIIVIWFFIPAPFASNEKVRSWSRDQNLIFKIMNYRFLTQILYLNFKENVEKMMW